MNVGLPLHWSCCCLDTIRPLYTKYQTCSRRSNSHSAGPAAVLGWNVVPDRLQVLRLLQILPFLMSVNAITLTLVSSNRKPCWQQRTPCFVTQCAVCTLCFASPVTLYQLDFLKTASRITLPAACHLHTAAHLPSRSTQCWPSQFCFWVSKNAKTETTAARKSSRRSMANCVCSLTTLTDAKIIWLRW